MIYNVSANAGNSVSVWRPIHVLNQPLSGKITFMGTSSGSHISFDTIIPDAKKLEVSSPTQWEALGISQEDYGWLKLAESSFADWDNEDDAIYDTL
ncbi:MAG: hypothetical protein WCI88_01315 [Chloroflexota bacterium]|jgi:hypothetical protein